MLAAFLATVLFACSAVFAARSARLVGVATANLARLWLGAGLLALWAHGRGAGLEGGAAALGTFLLSGAVGFGLGDLALFAALPRIGSRLTVLLVQCLAVPVAASMEWLWLGTTLSAAQTGCIALILGGVALAVAPAELRAGKDGGERPVTTMANASPPPDATRRAWRKGLVFGVAAALGQAGGAVISRRGFTLATAAGVHLDGGTAAYQRILGGLTIMTLGYGVHAWRERWRPRPTVTMATTAAAAMDVAEAAAEVVHHPRSPNRVPAATVPVTAATITVTGRWRRGWPWVVLNALAGPSLGVSCYQWALATTPSALVLPIVATTPLAVVPLAYVFEGERPGWRSLLGGVLAVTGAVVLATLKK